jgi:DNA processing protein
MEREELASWLRLVLTPGVGNDTARKLMAALGPPASLFASARSRLRELVSESLADALVRPPPQLGALVDATVMWLRSAEDGIGRSVLHLGDAGYPAALLDTEDPPLMLYLLGRIPRLWPRGIAIVGSRNPTPQGRDNAHEFGRSLAQAGLTVVSGLALGIDGAAHEGALRGAQPDQLATLAVVGTGLDRVYPRQHEPLARGIAQSGLIVSEYPLGTPPLAANFPRRNRLISGLSEGTLVVEAALRSGSLITARMALEQGKEVFAIPGSIHSTQSRGCHALLRQGAKLVESAQDVLEELRPGVVTAVADSREGAGDTMPAIGAGAKLLDALGYDPVSLDALQARTGEATAELQARLLELELDGHVARLPGGLFQRLMRG